jgi:hypothetical protein
MTSSLKINNILNPTGGAVQYRGLPEGNICNVTTMTWDRPIALTAFGSPAKITFFGGSFTKKYTHTALSVEVVVFGQGPYSGNCGTGLVLDYLQTSTGKESWDYGTSYTYDNQWQPYQIITLYGHAYFSNHQINGQQIAAGEHTMHFGMYVKRSDQGTNRPFNNMSPNASTTSDGRVGQTISTIVIREIGL